MFVMQLCDLQKDQLSDLAETFGLLADPTRLSIVITCMESERAAGDISKYLGLSASLTSHHLRLLRSARILKSERQGKQIIYSMHDACVESVLKTMSNHLFTHSDPDADH